MLATSTCPSRQHLRHYLIGQLSDSDSASVEAHLRHCRCCEGVVEQLDSQSLEDGEHDPLLDFLPQAAGLVGQTPRDGSDPRASQAEVSIEKSDEGSRGEDAWADLATRKLSSYELVQKIGSGGMGMVYRARHRNLDKWVAVKLLPARPGTDAAAIGRFQREMRLIGRLNHPAIVSATDAGVDGRTHFLVMELIDGLDLSRVARAVGRLGPADVAEIGRQVALGLDYAHSQGVIHRDIKPSNLMLDGQGQVKLLDLGLADLSPWCQPVDDWTTVGQLLGTLDYMAPEQAEGPRGIGHRTDLYSLGATLFRLLIGAPPLAPTPDGSPLEKLRLLATERPPAVRTLGPETPDDLARTIDQLLERDPGRRPSSAAVVAEQLAPLAGAADLRGLIEQARETLRDAGRELAPASPAQENFPAWPPEIAELDSNGVPDTSPRGNRGGWRGRGRRFVGALLAAAAGALVLAAILIVLETSQGQLVIETDEADVRVRVLSDGEPVRQLELQPGAMRLACADRYEIVIDQPTDRTVVVENGDFELRRGETVIARIRRQPAGTAPVVRRADGSQERVSPETVFDGKTTHEWVDVLRHERSIPKIQAAVRALIALQPQDPEGEIVELVLKVVRRHGLAALNEGVPSSEEYVEQLLAALTSPLDLSGRLLQDILARREPSVDAYGTLIDALCSRTMSVADARTFADEFLKVFTKLPQGEAYAATLGKTLANRLGRFEEHVQLATEIMDSILREFRDYPYLLFGPLHREIVRPANMASWESFSQRYEHMDVVRLLLSFPEWSRFDQSTISSLLTSMGNDLEYARELAPDLGTRLPKSVWLLTRDVDASPEVISATRERPNLTEPGLADRIHNGLTRMHNASRIEADLDAIDLRVGDVPHYQVIYATIDPFHLSLILALELGISAEEILDWLSEIREQTAAVFEEITQVSPKIASFQLDEAGNRKLMALLRFQLIVRPPLSYPAFTKRNRWIPRPTHPVSTSSLLHAPPRILEQLGLEPVDPGVLRVIEEHLTGYWDYILVTGVMRLLTEDGPESGSSETSTR